MVPISSQGHRKEFQTPSILMGEQVAKKYIENMWSRSRAPEPIDGANYLTLFIAACGVMTAPTRGEYEHGYAFAAPWHARTIQTRLSKEQDCTTWSVSTTGEPPVFVAMAQPWPFLATRNPFDSWLPAPLSLRRAAVFLERTLEPGGVDTL